jgi:hypothetical protein
LEFAAVVPVAAIGFSTAIGAAETGPAAPRAPIDITTAKRADINFFIVPPVKCTLSETCISTFKVPRE